ncbi:MAG: AAA family ATPase [Thermoguttaceae bacterium]|nr:AAA family ATPase [Thermoguttaceae bacterium]
MLLQFTVENFRSFRDETVFDMFPTGLQTLREHLYTDEQGKRVQALPVAIIYGANASGKTNLLEAVNFASRFVQNGVGLNQPIGVVPFVLDPKTKEKPSRFEFVFKIDAVIYTYGFILSKSAVEAEWLFAYFSSREEVVFERKMQGGITTIHLGRRLKKRELRGTDTCVGGNMLFMTFAHDRNEVLESVYRWFKESLYILPASNLENMARIIHDTPFLTSFISKKLRETDVGIDSVFVAEENESPGKKERNLSSSDTDGKSKYVLYSRHRDTDGNEVVLPVSTESDGTRRMIELIPLLNEKNNKNVTFFVDEMDRSIHPVLVRWLLEHCLKIAQTGKCGFCQFIFTTHNTNLLNRNLLRRDEIWFTEKDSNGCSRLSRLSEFKVNEGLNYENGYLNGRFGAIPLADITMEVQ